MAHVPPDRRPTARFPRLGRAPSRRAHEPFVDAAAHDPYAADPYASGPYAPAPEPERPARPSWRRDRPGPQPAPRTRPDPTPAAGRPRRRLLRRISRVLAVIVVVQALVILSLRWIDPPTTAFMAANPGDVVQQSVPIEHVSRNFLAAVIAHEDAALPHRSGAFAWGALMARAEAHLAGDEDPSGSTIPQQVAKNLFLNQEMSAWRKVVEAGLSAELALALDDRRMLELYVNYAQFGPTIYGVCAASWYYFDSPPQDLPVPQAVQLVGLLPSPGHVQRAPGGGLDFDVEDGLGWLSRSHVVNAQNRVPRHIERLGFQPVEDIGVTGLAADQPASDDDCSTRPQEVADLIAAEGTA
ncbi:transglycosylase domain-containing protein [Geodermatophilus sabuli]|uniref:Monofunctional biosynthetic peptidoglycan transglycosylase n=1 Tax=Geodermatophilus sabuli TaxID=1564158 RepID=A0A285EI57_9ACTN|nr:transglycosylase domain-containing protein [Geodermatophilus sabuli]MBB3086632.1 monofunctional biosynthetic peptidoglycan transglycosylase [Geodermatophilus sabuli]SNX97716.1 monofunctional biosynthetic peptidoglycan transglycosylase [Geodermatophilus sabuli]